MSNNNSNNKDEMNEVEKVPLSTCNENKSLTFKLSAVILLYILISLTIRLMCAIYLSGYIHPDEFFQSGQELFFSTSQEISWEFEPHHAIRSIVPPIFMTVLPLRIASFLQAIFLIVHPSTSISTSISNQSNVDGNDVLYNPRVGMVFLSLICIDLPLAYLLHTKYTNNNSDKHENTNNYTSTKRSINENNTSVPLSIPLLINQLFLTNTSWPVLLFFNRTFTNTLETMCIATLLSLCTLHHSFTEINNKSSISNNKNLLSGYITATGIGIICAIGLFVRFTSVFFAFPIVLITLLKFLKGKKKNRIVMLYSFFMMTFGFLMTSYFFIHVDSLFYNGIMTTLEKNKEQSSFFFITPLSALLYNSQIDNLSDHGIHPRVTHLLVNMPLLFGPLVLYYYKDFLLHLFFVFFAKNEKKEEQQGDDDNIMISTMCRWSLFSGLFVLSCAPHQEPRFLLPLFIPLFVLHGSQYFIIQSSNISYTSSGSIVITKSPHSIRKIMSWLIYNIIFLFFFGVFHQSGIVPSLQHLALQKMHPTLEQTTKQQHVTFFHTYMPPTFLVTVNNDSDLLSSSQFFSVQSIIQTVKAKRERKQQQQNDSNNNYEKVCSPSSFEQNSCIHNHHSLITNNIIITDLKGSDYQTLRETLETNLKLLQGKEKKSGHSKQVDNIVVKVVAPPSVMQSFWKWYNSFDSKNVDTDIMNVRDECKLLMMIPNKTGATLNDENVWYYSFHLNLDDIVTSSGKDILHSLFGLAIFDVTCK